MQISEKYQIKSRFLFVQENTGDTEQNHTFAKQAFSKESFLIESFSDGKLSGHILILPLFSKSKPHTKQAVLFSDLSYSTISEAKSLIREGLMCSWEIGYKVAITTQCTDIFKVTGFSELPSNIFFSQTISKNFGIIELSWDGIKKLSKDLIFPSSHNFESEN